jgi:uncharacterized OB-fold protein
MAQVPMVEYLRLDGEPVLVANECTSCGARFFDRRNACASCSANEFTQVEIDRLGEVTSFSIVSYAAPGVEVPFVPAVVDCGGTSVRGNIVNVEPSPEHIRLGMPVRLATYVAGVDGEGTEAIGFGFEPAEETT